MKRITLLSLLVLLFGMSAAGCADGSRVTAKDLNEFAVRCGKYEMWAEAEFKLRDALAHQGDDAALHNNIAVALEAQAKLEEAYAEYTRAVALDPGNKNYRRNMDNFVNDHKWAMEGESEEEE